MGDRIQIYLKEFIERFIILAVLIVIAFTTYKVFTFVNQEIVGSIFFIWIFSLGIMYYYFSLFTKTKLRKSEYILSILFVFFLTISIYAVIYAEPIENSDSYFIQFGQPTNLTFADAFYFSTTTITTLGCGEISPVGVYRYFVILEVIMGLIYTGSMIYFIIRILEKK